MIKKIFFFLLIIFYASFFLKPISLTGVDGDLGRHLKSGEMVLASGAPAAVNLFSYTCPDCPVVDHHWGAGVIFYLVHALGGFALLNGFAAAVGLAAFLIFLAAARRGCVGADGPAPLLVGFLLVPLIAQRTAVRPEMFSYFFIAVFYYILSGVSKARVSRRWLLAIPLIEMLWVNLHVYFMFGILLVGVFTIEKAVGVCLNKDNQVGATGRSPLLSFAATFILTAAAALVNPFGARIFARALTLSGAIAPLFVESSSLFEAPPGYLPYIIIFWTAAALLVVTFVVNGINAGATGRSPLLTDVILMTVFGALSVLKVRALPLFGLLCIPILSANLSIMLARIKRVRPAMLWIPVILIAAFHVGAFRGQMGLDLRRLGAKPGTFDAVDFFREEDLKGPVFNNFKSGGLLIYRLFPTERVFIDQRLEAYPPRLHDKRNYLTEPAWREWDRKYHFNVIFFAVPFKRSLEADFLTARLRDPAWAIVYADGTALVLLRDTAANEEVIRRHRLKH